MYIEFENLKKYGFLGIQTTRKAGNMKEKENLYPLLDKLNIDKNNLVKGVQTHSINILCLEENTDISNIENIDGYITDNPKYTLMAYFADCMPIFIIDKKKKVYGLLHGGWRGSSNGILKEAINIMKSKYGSNVNDIIVTFGICISSKNYEIKEDVIKELKLRLNFDTMIESAANKFYLSLSKMNEQIAINQGVPRKNIIVNDYCTYAGDFFSYRKEKTDKRMIALLKVGIE
ncbi:polyphenol oxidase family protein [Oceanivirga salmonicida]|uniref:polyphenol oxidase family protein n=1 Tax=Oceanivirga salmonicida TaxID=1769291 RepID=UPI0012E0CC1A|nr:polyphenol oxidase family protein [Oceanivirga salmonicida]